MEHFHPEASEHLIETVCVGKYKTCSSIPPKQYKYLGKSLLGDLYILMVSTQNPSGASSET